MFIFTNATLIDGNGKEPVKNASVTVEGNTITAVGASQRSYPEHATVVDLAGRVVMPGLIDVHNHFGGVTRMRPGIIPMGNVFTSNMYALARKTSIENGVTTVRSCGDFYRDIVRLHEVSVDLYGPRIFATGPLFTAPGGHPAGTIMKPFPSMQKNATRQVGDPNTAREEVRKVIAGGVNYIKCILGDLDPWKYPGKVPKLAFNVLEAIIDEAHKHNIAVLVHTETPTDAANAVKAGADGIEHVIMPGLDTTVPDGLIKAILDRGVCYSPTLTVNQIYGVMFPTPNFKELLAFVKQLDDAGGNVVLGTDAGSPQIHFGWAAHREMELFVEAGMSPMHAIMAATKKAAVALQKQKELGTIEAGKLADIIVVDGNPAKKITDIKNVKLVMKNGKVLVDNLKLPMNNIDAGLKKFFM